MALGESIKERSVAWVVIGDLGWVDPWPGVVISGIIGSISDL